MAKGVRVKLKWHGAKVKKDLQKEEIKRLKMVGAFLEGKVKKNISIPTRSAGPSTGGEMPHADTGHLRKSIFHDVDEKRKTVIVGTPVKYGLFLEVGTSKMAARPYLRATVNQEKTTIGKILGSGSTKFV